MIARVHGGLKRTTPALLLALACLLGTPAMSAACPGPSGDAYAKAVLADAPIAYYRLDESSGSTLCDSSISATNGTYKASSVSLGSSGVLLNSPDTAVQGSGGGGIGDSGPGVSGNHSFTLEGWLRGTGNDQTQILVDMGTAGTGNIAGLGVTQQTTGSDLILDTYDG
ncbi:MAG: hypothetical protein ACRDJ3_05980 [Solirubrobacteraceae bacterium]